MRRRGARARRPPDPGRYTAIGRHSPRIGGQRLDHALVEHLRLIGVEDPAHREKMLERFLLQCSHHTMRLVARFGSARSIPMFGFNRIREPDIGWAHVAFHSPETTPVLSAPPSNT